MFEIHIYKRSVENIYIDTNVIVYKCTTFDEALTYTESHKDLNKDERYVIVKLKY